MRQDQFEKLQAIAERLADVVIIDADPATWAGAGLTSGTMTQQQRGDAYWSRKMAVATIGVMMRVETIIGNVTADGRGTTPPATPTPEAGDDHESMLDSEVESCQREAAKLFDRMQRATEKADAEAKTHGARPR